MKTLFILGMVLLSANSFAGNEKGNGGGVHFCKSAKTLELYDIYEGQARYGFAIKESSLAVDAQVKNAVEKIKRNNPYIGKLVQEKINYLKNGHMIVRSKVKLTPIGDAKILLVDEGCTYNQLANWDEVSGNLIVSKDLYDRMNSTNQAALYIHETLYKVGRDLGLITIEADGTSTSDEIRRMVGEVFSTGTKLEQLWTTVDPQIQIDKEEAEFAVLVKKINAEVGSCSKSAESYAILKKSLKDNVCDIKAEEVSGYMKSYFEAIGACMDSQANIQSNSRHEVAMMADSSAYRYLAELSNASEIVRSNKNAISSAHERFMSNVMNCKN